MPSVLWRCWLGGRKDIRPVKTEWWGAGVVICLERGADLHTSQLMPLPLTVSCSSKIQIGFTFLVPAHLGSPGQRAVKRTCICVDVKIFLGYTYAVRSRIRDIRAGNDIVRWPGRMDPSYERTGMTCDKLCRGNHAGTLQPIACTVLQQGRHQTHVAFENQSFFQKSQTRWVLLRFIG